MYSRSEPQVSMAFRVESVIQVQEIVKQFVFHASALISISRPLHHTALAAGFLATLQELRIST